MSHVHQETQDQLTSLPTGAMLTIYIWSLCYDPHKMLTTGETGKNTVFTRLANLQRRKKLKCGIKVPYILKN